MTPAYLAIYWGNYNQREHPIYSQLYSDIVLGAYMLKIYLKYKKVILYIAFGGLTTLVNVITYFSLAKLLGIQYLISNVVAWTVSVLFAYATNRLYVFASNGQGLIFILGECSAFIGCRLFSGLLDTTVMYVLIDLLRFKDLFVKIIANLLVIILNYGLSKRIVFKDKGQGEVSLWIKSQ